DYQNNDTICNRKILTRNTPHVLQILDNMLCFTREPTSKNLLDGEHYINIGSSIQVSPMCAYA
ncbi:MAG TPA: hypothetical protein VFS97_08285, partial [Nitrososphaeraceae archaeon]|nr:hypothetical protein [Nitrososphaeraceae archaeon]